MNYQGPFDSYFNFSEKLRTPENSLRVKEALKQLLKDLNVNTNAPSIEKHKFIQKFLDVLVDIDPDYFSNSVIKRQVSDALLRALDVDNVVLTEAANADKESARYVELSNAVLQLRQNILKGVYTADTIKDNTEYIELITKIKQLLHDLNIQVNLDNIINKLFIEQSIEQKLEESPKFLVIF